MAMRVGQLDAPLLKLNPWDHFRLRDAVQGVLITGGIGSGKTSGSGQALAGAYLCAGFGGLVCCAKPEEVELWRDYARRHGRAKSLMEFDGAKFRFNPIAYELARNGWDGINNVIEIVMRMLEIARNVSPSPSRGGDEFWENTTRQKLRNAIPVLYAAYGTVRISDLLRFVRSAPRVREEMRDPAWQAASFFYQTFALAADKLPDDLGERVIAYWRDDFATLDPKTRSNILISLTTALDRFNNGWLRDAFCSDSNIVPELCFDGSLIILNLPALTHNEDGIIAQQLFKFMWQRAMLARNGLPRRYRERPVFLWADEAQYFINSYDAEFLSTCRGSLVCVVFLSQSLPTYYAKMAGDNARDRVHHLLGNFATKIWHNLGGCAETAEWAAKTLGRKVHLRQNWSEGQGFNRNMGMNAGEGTNWGRSFQSGGNSSHSSNGGSSHGSSWSAGGSSGGSENWGRNQGLGNSSNSNHGYSEQVDWVLEPAEFSRGLKTGGPANANRVSAVWYQAGRAFRASGTNALMAEFRQ